MKRIGVSSIILAVALSVFCPARSPTLHAQKPDFDDGRDEGRQNILTVNHFVPHVSTVFANDGLVRLFVRERVHRGHHRTRGVVLMIHGATTPAVPVFDLPFRNYNWMADLAESGFDVFAMDLQGYGSSPRPTMDDPCNTSVSEQKLYLIPNPLSQPCSPTYPFRLTSIQSDWDEIDTVVDYLRQLRHVDTVNILAWSRGGPRAGGYVARHPEKVERLVLYAPAYNRLSPDHPLVALPQPGVPMTVLGRANFSDVWDGQVKCENQFEPAIRDVIASTILEFDPLGSTWGAAGVRRAPVWNTGSQNFPNWGWNAHFASLIKVPTLFIRGDLDTQVPEPDVKALYADIGSPDKVFIHVACASHYLVWENQHMALLTASKEWLRHGTFDDQTAGSFFVDVNGIVHQE
jgi:pimeloyl-ACP methyl ester carboxylesterase